MKKSKKEEIIKSIESDLLDDLMDFTGLSYSYIKKNINRNKKSNYVYEFKIRNPRDTCELDWFYVTSEKYLFANVAHNSWKLIDMVEGNEILDYGGGTGIDNFFLSKKGFEVDYFDISLVQREFVEFRCNKHGITNVNTIKSYYKNKFDPIGSIQKNYDGVLIRSVLEHVPYYPELAKHLANKIRVGGHLYEASPFGKSKKDPMHIEKKISIENIFEEEGLVLVYEESLHRIWEKVKGGSLIWIIIKS